MAAALLFSMGLVLAVVAFLSGVALLRPGAVGISRVVTIPIMVLTGVIAALFLWAAVVQGVGSFLDMFGVEKRFWWDRYVTRISGRLPTIHYDVAMGEYSASSAEPKRSMRE